MSDQAERAKVLDITKSFLVQAPAGSGKTAILVQRFLKVLANVQSAPEEIVAITFTRKAATEMRERILDALQMATEPESQNDEYKQTLQQLAKQVLVRDQQEGWQLLNNPARLKIQTIDALCTSITRQMPILSRFGAQPQIEQQPEALYERAVDQLLHALDHDPSYPSNDGLFKLLQHLDNDRLKVRKLLVRMLQIREHWLPIVASHMHTQNLRDFLERGLVFACEEALADLDNIVPPVLDLEVINHSEPQSISEWLVIIDKLLTAEGDWRKKVGVDQGFHAPSKATDKEEKQRLKAAKDAMHDMLDRLCTHDEFRQQLLVLRELPPLAYTEQQWDILAALIAVLPVLAAQLTVVFSEQAQVDFIAVALAAINALQDQDAPSDLSLALDCKIRHILVDEFQDTSLTQFRLLECLTANWDQDDGRTLFFVGDPMQSIYRFRHAEVGLFLRTKQQGIGSIHLEFVQLKRNFRSTPNIIHWLNQTFAASFPKVDNKTLGAITYMLSHAADSNILEYEPVQCLDVADSLEPQAIIDIIKNQQQTDPKQTIAILVRAKSHLLRILPALRTAKIEFQGLEIENLSQRPAIQDLLALTNAILHLDDRIAWLAILRAPWCGLSLVDLQIIAANDLTIFAAIQSSDVFAGLSNIAQIRVKRLAVVMHNTILFLGRTPFAHLVKTAYWGLGGDHCAADTIESGLEFQTFFEFLQSIEHKPEIYEPGYIAQQLTDLCAKPYNRDTNAVQIMTMHKAKGLEFDVVILPGLTKSTRWQEQQLLLLEQRDYEHEYILFAPIRAAEEKEDPIYNYLAWCERQRAEHEVLRMLYVAATRAKQKIYCLGDTENKSGMLAKIWPQVANQFISYIPNNPEKRIGDNSLRRLPDAWFGEHNEAPDSQLTTEQRMFKTWHVNWVSHAGTVMHRILWHITNVGVEKLPTDFLQTLPRICDLQLKSLGMLQTDHAKAINLIVNAVQNMLKDPFGLRILSNEHQETFAEWSITKVATLKPDIKCDNIRLDRVFLDHDSTLWLIDYKLVPSDHNIAEAIQKNVPQILEYSEVLNNLKPGFKLVAGLYFPLQTYWHQVC